jgi:hypothetical protein
MRPRAIRRSVEGGQARSRSNRDPGATMSPLLGRDLAGWGWFFVFVATGAAAGLGAVSLGPLLLAPAVVVASALLFRSSIRRSAFGLLSGAGFLSLYVAWVNRDGPGTTCWQTATATGCDEHLNPLPWLVFGILLVGAGVAGHAIRAQ